VSLYAALGLLVSGLLLLMWGGDVLVRNAVRIASVAGLTPAVIGLTVVAMGTSLPEGVVSVGAAFTGRADIAIGNVVGSNILNITGTLGLAALIAVLPIRTRLVTLEWPVLLVATSAAVLFMRDAEIDRWEGGFFLISLLVFTTYSVYLARGEVTQQERVALESEVDALAPQRPNLASAIAMLVFGLLMLLLGGDLLVRGAVEIARYGGLDERVIGLTVVAIGTGAPEIATSIVAALRKQTDIAVANMIGSNIFNLLGILGTAAVVRPIAFSPAVAATDSLWMLGTTVLLLPIMLYGRRIVRWEGALLLAVYAVYLALLL
jgi:cation:H+ antiporter